MIGIIAAVSRNGIIGQGGKIPWSYPEDMKYFRKTTANSTIIMGRKTFESIGKALPKRRNIVISSRKIDSPDVETFPSVTEAMNIVDATPAIAQFDENGKLVDMSRPIWFIGGASIYEMGMIFANEIHLTLVSDHIVPDSTVVKFPWINPLQFQMTEMKRLVPGDSTLTLAIYKSI